MRNLSILFKALLSVMLVAMFVLNTNAQDWTAKKSGLYYVGSQGKVFLEPDYNAMAIYFESDVSMETGALIKDKLVLSESASDIEVQTMDLKGIVRVKSSSAIETLSDLNSRTRMLTDLNVRQAGAYDVLPAFTVADKQAWFTKRVSLRLIDGISLDDLSDVLDKYNATYIKNIINDNTYLLNVQNIANQLPLIQELNDMGVLVWGQPDFKMELVKNISDPMYSDSWHLNNTGGSIDGKALVPDIDVNAPEAWGITKGNSNIVVAVIDDGVEAHEDMPSLLPGYTPVENGGDGTPALSTDGHGQQCAGLISAQHNGMGAAGIAPDCNTFSVNIFAPNTTNADVAEGIVWAVDQGADVLTNSWGFGSCTYNDPSITDAFSYAANQGRGGLGCVILIASGNDFQSCVSFPANLPTVTAVGGISGDGERSMYSNYGPALDIVSPSDDDWVKQGRQYYSTGTHGLRTIDRMGSNGWYSGNYSEAMGGTSGATPQVAAVAALVLSVDANLTKSEVENILYSTAKDMGDVNQYGAGLVDAYAAVVAASGGGGGGDTEAPTAPTNLASANITTGSFTLSWSASSDNEGVAGYDVFQNGAAIGSTANTSYNVNGLSSATTYSYYVKAKDAAGNVSAASNTLNVTTQEESQTNTAPVADAGGPYTGDEGASIAFDGSGSFDADGDALSYSWNFGDGATGTGVTPTHTYTTAGSYTATLTVSDGTDSDQATASVTVNAVGGADLPMISAVSVSTSTAGPWTKLAGTITITSGGQPLANAYVDAAWSGDFSGSATGYTGADGTLSFNEKSKEGSAFTLTVSDVTLAGYYWDVDNSQVSASTGGTTMFSTRMLDEELTFNVYPNPVSGGMIKVIVPELENATKAVIYQISGKAEIVTELTKVETQISVHDLSPGMYIIRIDGQPKPQRIIVQ
jgi:subtilisin family serine protease